MRREPAFYSNQFVCVVECHTILAMASLSRPSSLIVPPLATFRGLVDQFLPWLSAICRTQSVSKFDMNNQNANQRIPSKAAFLVSAGSPGMDTRSFHKCMGTSASSALTAFENAFASSTKRSDLRCASPCTPNEPILGSPATPRATSSLTLLNGSSWSVASPLSLGMRKTLECDVRRVSS
jgi:hypothetical protein